MKRLLEPGKYVVAVSGGVDSVALLNMLSNESGLSLVVAHFDHGIRADSSEDAAFVERLAGSYGLPFGLGQARLGPNASEALAREKRYDFLKKVAKKYQADAIVTAHHQDDVVETALINLLRGTKHKGLASLRSTNEIKRPLLDFTKKQLIVYAQDNNLEWREDSTNLDTKFLRNKIRLLLKNADPKLLEQTTKILQQSREKSEALDNMVNGISRSYIKGQDMDRKWFMSLPHVVACEVMASYLRSRGIPISRHVIEQSVVDAKTLMPGKVSMLPGAAKLLIGRDQIRLEKHN